jgi:hypothetical protein
MVGKYLITTDSWFYAPDGHQYRSVWGSVQIVGDTILGIKTNTKSSNWFAQVGSDDKHVIVAGCQIHYAVKCNEKPNTDEVEQHEYDTKADNKVLTRTRIYIAE